MIENSWKDVGEGVVGAMGMVLAFLTPMLRHMRSHWGLTEEEAARPLPGDELVPSPRWSWTHGIEIDAPAEDVWPWVVQIGQGRGGFYSYQFLENIAGCEVDNAEAIDPKLQELHLGDGISLHPKMPPFPVKVLEPGRCFVVYTGGDLDTGKPLEPGDPRPAHFAAVSWGFYVDPLSEDRCRFISRYRSGFDVSVKERPLFDATFMEPVGFVMDRRMLMGVKARVEAVRNA